MVSTEITSRDRQTEQLEVLNKLYRPFPLIFYVQKNFGENMETIYGNICRKESFKGSLDGN